DLVALAEDLLRTDPRRRPEGAEVLRRLHVDPGPEAHRSRPITDARTREAFFVGRARELGVLRAAADALDEGRGAVVLVRGPSGIGKSVLVQRLVAELAEADPGVVVLAGRCYERESLPFKAFDGVFDQLSRVLKKLPRGEAEALVPRG